MFGQSIKFDFLSIMNSVTNLYPVVVSFGKFLPQIRSINLVAAALESVLQL